MVRKEQLPFVSVSSFLSLAPGHLARKLNKVKRKERVSHGTELAWQLSNHYSQTDLATEVNCAFPLE